ncbi:MAG: hypothetical protein OIF57_00245 [Marinobacterium sp.]|nr:hypothetical protein [Marinobacterium sp.]
MSIKQIINQLNTLDNQVQGWASGQKPLPGYEEVIRLRVQMAALLYVPLDVATFDGPAVVTLGSCTQQNHPIPESIYEKLLLLRSQILNFDQQLSNLQNQLELMMHSPRQAAVH